MTEPIKGESTEQIPDETWCTSCKVPVAGWVVEFDGPDSEGSYTKILRCPNCNEKSFDHTHGDFGCVLFIVGMAVSMFCAFIWAKLTGVELLASGEQDMSPEGIKGFKKNNFRN